MGQRFLLTIPDSTKISSHLIFRLLLPISILQTHYYSLVIQPLIRTPHLIPTFEYVEYFFLHLILLSDLIEEKPSWLAVGVWLVQCRSMFIVVNAFLYFSFETRVKMLIASGFVYQKEFWSFVEMIMEYVVVGIWLFFISSSVPVEAHCFCQRNETIYISLLCADWGVKAITWIKSPKCHA